MGMLLRQPLAGRLAAVSTLILTLVGCGLFSAGEVVYTRGARQHTATVELAVAPRRAYEAMLRVAETSPGWTIVSNDPTRLLVEAEEGKRSVAAQATELGSNSTLLFIWADAGDSAETGRDLAAEAMRDICNELDVRCKFRER
jgi:hypothetical protein